MCGIAGIWSFNSPLHEEELRQFTRALSHRGPDDEGLYLDQEARLGLGHRRLSILDLSPKARQPMSFLDRYYLSFNGEIFNFLELKKELCSAGYRFKTETDSEVILLAYHHYGEKFLLKLNGMWGLAIYDKQEKLLFLARDRFGIKPLYYTRQPGQYFAFASETRAFRSLARFKRSFDENNLLLSLQHSEQLEGAGKTIFAGITHLRPGHYALVKDDDFEEKKWWDSWEHTYELSGNYQDQVGRFQELFQDACRIRLRSDVPLASALSGGIDSSSVYAKVQRLMNASPPERTPAVWNKAYVLSFPGSPRDETHYARQVIDHYGGEANYVEPRKVGADEIVEYTRQFDSVYHNPNYILCRLYEAMAADGIKISLEGHGVDELLFGYPFMLRQLIQVADGQLKPFKAEELEGLLKSIGGEAASPLRQVGLWQRLRNKFNGASRNSDWFPAGNPARPGSFSSANEVVDQAFHHSTLPSILRNFDRASMLSGIETRMPFMDHRLVSFLLSLPLESKISTSHTKRILRDAMQGQLPESIRLRQNKMGLIAPMDQIFNNELKDFLKDMTASRSFLENPLWNGAEIRKFVQQRTGPEGFAFHDGFRLWPVISAYIIGEDLRTPTQKKAYA